MTTTVPPTDTGALKEAEAPVAEGLGAAWEPPFKPSTPIGTHGDNVYGLIAGAHRVARRLDYPRAWWDAFYARIDSSGSYRAACEILAERFTISGTPEWEEDD